MICCVRDVLSLPRPTLDSLFGTSSEPAHRSRSARLPPHLKTQVNAALDSWGTSPVFARWNHADVAA